MVGETVGPIEIILESSSVELAGSEPAASSVRLISR
jgi:hypothetical protein